MPIVQYNFLKFKKMFWSLLAMAIFQNRVQVLTSKLLLIFTHQGGNRKQRKKKTEIFSIHCFCIHKYANTHTHITHTYTDLKNVLTV